MSKFIRRCPACLGGPLPERFPVCENCRLGTTDMIKVKAGKPYEYIGTKPSSIDARRKRSLARMSQKEKNYLGVYV